jgi:hypothetical protein
MEKLKVPFLASAAHYDELGKHGGQYAALLAFAALDPQDVFTVSELAGATQSLPPNGLKETAEALTRSVDSAGDQRADFWKNRVVRYLRRVWPNTRRFVSPSLSENLGRLCVAARGAFPEAMALLRGWLSPPEHPDYIVRLLHEEGLCSRFPAESLDFLDLLIADRHGWLPRELGTCVDQIATANPALKDDPRFVRLVDLVRQHR